MNEAFVISNNFPQFYNSRDFKKRVSFAGRWLQKEIMVSLAVQPSAKIA